MLYVAYQKKAHSAKVEGTGHISHAETGAWPAVGRYGCGNPGRMKSPIARVLLIAFASAEDLDSWGF